MLERSGGAKCGDGGSLLAWAQMEWRMEGGEGGEANTFQLEQEKICEKLTSWKFSLQNQVRQATISVLVLQISDLITER